MKKLPSADELQRIITEHGFSAYRRELERPWDSEDDDFSTAMSVLRKVQKIKFIEDYESNGDQAKVTFPQWVMDLRELYEKQYGPDKGWVIFVKVQAKILREAHNFLEVTH